MYIWHSTNCCICSFKLRYGHLNWLTTLHLPILEVYDGRMKQTFRSHTPCSVTWMKQKRRGTSARVVCSKFRAKIAAMRQKVEVVVFWAEETTVKEYVTECSKQRHLGQQSVDKHTEDTQINTTKHTRGPPANNQRQQHTGGKTSGTNMQDQSATCAQ